MQIVENLNDNLVEQLFELYTKTWFTPNRTVSDIEIMLSNSYLTLAFVENKKLIGFSRVISDGVYKAFIYDVIVQENYQSKGFGKLIMETLLNHDKLKKVDHIELYCLEEISGFYKKLGFHNSSLLLLRLQR